MTANPLFAARCGRRDAVAKLVGNRLRADVGLAPETGRWVIPGLTSEIDPERPSACLTRSPRRQRRGCSAEP
jgi:hypothetical protein